MSSGQSWSAGAPGRRLPYVPLALGALLLGGSLRYHLDFRGLHGRGGPFGAVIATLHDGFGLTALLLASLLALAWACALLVRESSSRGRREAFVFGITAVLFASALAGTWHGGGAFGDFVGLKVVGVVGGWVGSLLLLFGTGLSLWSGTGRLRFGGPAAARFKIPEKQGTRGVDVSNVRGYHVASPPLDAQPTSPPASLHPVARSRRAVVACAEEMESSPEPATEEGHENTSGEPPVAREARHQEPAAVKGLSRSMNAPFDLAMETSVSMESVEEFTSDDATTGVLDPTSFLDLPGDDDEWEEGDDEWEDDDDSEDDDSEEEDEEWEEDEDEDEDEEWEEDEDEEWEEDEESDDEEEDDDEEWDEEEDEDEDEDQDEDEEWDEDDWDDEEEEGDDDEDDDDDWGDDDDDR